MARRITCYVGCRATGEVTLVAAMPEERHLLRRPDGAHIAYSLLRNEKHRPLLVLIHGMASNMTRWSEFFAHTALRESWGLLRLDLRGHGGSSRRTRIGMEVWSDDLAAILSTEAYDSAVIGGHCLGANLAVHFAYRYPKLTRGLVLIEPMPREAHIGLLRWVPKLSAFIALTVRLIKLLNTFGLYRRRLADVDLAELDRRTREQMNIEGDARSLSSRYASPFSDLRTMSWADYLQDLIETVRLLPPLRSIAVPVLALTSKGAHFADPGLVEKALAEMPSLTIQQLDALHWIPTEQPVVMRRAIETWCNFLMNR